MSAKPSNPEQNAVHKKQAIEIIEQMQKLGFPNQGNVADLQVLMNKLDLLAPQFSPLHQAAIQRLGNEMQKIQDQLQKGDNVPVKLYVELNQRLVIFKENMIANQFAA